MDLAQFGVNPDGGFGMMQGQELADLQKAMEAGYGTSPESQQGGGAFRVESLENSLKVLTFQQNDIKFWKKIPKLRATNTVEEYNQLINYGGLNGAFTPEGALPENSDSQYQRKAAFVKFLGTTRNVTLPMTLVRSAHGDVIARYNLDGINWILQRAESALFWGNSQLVAGGIQNPAQAGGSNGGGVQFDGMDQMIDPSMTLDLKGNDFQEFDLNMGAAMLAENYARPTDLFLPYEVSAQFSNEFLPKERVVIPENNADYRAGINIGSINTIGGAVNFNPDIFLQRTPKLPTQATHAKAPAAPASVAIQDAGTNTTTDGDFSKSGQGTYQYYVTAANRYGESIATQAGTALTLGSGDLSKSWTLTITSAASSQFPVDYFKVYRTEADGTQAYQIDQIPASSATAGATTTYKDTNYRMPNTYTCFMGQMTEDVIAFKSLNPGIMKMDLGTIDASYRWMILLFGVPVLYAPRKWMRFINVKSEITNNFVDLGTV